MAFCQEYRAVLGFAQESKQWELPVCGLAFPLFPCVGHNSTL
jgi:hypothetical protein